MRRIFTKTRIAILTGAYLALSAIGGVLLVEISLHPPTLRPVDAAALARAVQIAERFGGTVIPLATKAEPGGVSLRAWLIRPARERANGNGVLLLHGVSDSRAGVLGFAPFLLDRGYTLLLPDARAHGESGGVATYGLVERNDVRRWAGVLREKLPAGRSSTTCVYGLGASMGAAMLLQSLAGDNRDFCAVTADSPFAEFKEVAFDRVGQPFGAGPWLGKTLLRPLVEVAFVYAKGKYGCEFSDASPQLALNGSQVPVLLIHGEQDYNIPIRHAQALKAAHPALEFWSVPGASHTGAHGIATEEYERRVLNWFASANSSAASAVSASKPPGPSGSVPSPARGH